MALYAAAALTIGAGATWWSWPPDFPTPTDEKDKISAVAEQTKAQTDAIRTGMAAAGGAGAAFTLLLAVRRQRSTEEMDAATRHDAEQRRMTELYTAAVEQLGHDSAAVRLGALYALQRLGQDHPEQRRPIVNVWCAYLRMPFRNPDAADLVEEERAERRQELEVRLTVQRLLREHAHSGPHKDRPASPRYWGEELDVDLTGATLIELDLRDCRVHPRTIFTNATLLGDTEFYNATFPGNTWFDGARFTGEAAFDDVTFKSATTSFHAATFCSKDTSFEDAIFAGKLTKFDGATFRSKRTSFTGAVASLGDKHVWPAGWQLQPADDVAVPDGGGPDVMWGRLIWTSGAESGQEGPAEDASGDVVST